jgi:hypothetical protein
VEVVDALLAVADVGIGEVDLNVLLDVVLVLVVDGVYRSESEGQSTAML